MNKRFNITADCKPKLHYMVDLTSRLAQIKEYVDRGEYFTINRARQYGKTTTLRALKEYLKDSYCVISMDFQMQMSEAKFRSENAFSIAFAKAFISLLQNLDTAKSAELAQAAETLSRAAREKPRELELVELFQHLSSICGAAGRPLVLIIDEADSAANNQVFLDFLAQLRGYYIDRDSSKTFQSVILAGVYDIKNLKRKLRPDQEHKQNSPWNIAADFKVEMSFSAEEIAGMLQEYEAEHETGMNITQLSELLYEHTSGYPYLVSRLCKLIDEEVAGSESFPTHTAAWTLAGFFQAQKLLLEEKNTLFESMVNKLYDFPELKTIISSILFTGREVAYNALNPDIAAAEMFGFIKNVNGTAAISNRIFEMVFYNLFLTSAEIQNTELYKAAVQEITMNTLQNTISMMKTLPEADLLKVQEFTKKLFRRHELEAADEAVAKFLGPKSAEDIYRDLEISRKQAEVGAYQEMEEALDEICRELRI